MRCPKCGSKNIARILWGEPAFDEKLEKDLANGKVVLGGCVISEDDQKLHCNDCEHEFSPIPHI